MTFLTLSPYLVVGAILAAAAAMLVNYFIHLFRGQGSGTGAGTGCSGCSGCSGCPSAPKCGAANGDTAPKGRLNP